MCRNICAPLLQTEPELNYILLATTIILSFRQGFWNEGFTYDSVGSQSNEYDNNLEREPGNIPREDPNKSSCKIHDGQS